MEEDIKTGDIYIASQDFENIGATVHKGEYIFIEKKDYEGPAGDISTKIYTSTKDIDTERYIARWKLETYAIKTYCTKYVDPKITEAKARSIKVPVHRRMSQDEFRNALAAL